MKTIFILLSLLTPLLPAADSGWRDLLREGMVLATLDQMEASSPPGAVPASGRTGTGAGSS